MVKPHITNDTTNQQADSEANDRLFPEPVEGSNGPLPVRLGVSLLRSSYPISNLRRFVLELDSLLWLELEHRRSIASYEATTGTLFVPFEDDLINPFIDRTKPLPRGSFKWSDYQIQVAENLSEGLKALESDIFTIARRLLKYLHD